MCAVCVCESPTGDCRVLSSGQHIPAARAAAAAAVTQRHPASILGSASSCSCSSRGRLLMGRCCCCCCEHLCSIHINGSNSSSWCCGPGISVVRHAQRQRGGCSSSGSRCSSSCSGPAPAAPAVRGCRSGLPGGAVPLPQRLSGAESPGAGRLWRSGGRNQQVCC
jgi:hypothetical protein